MRQKRMTQFQPQPLTKPISVKIEQGTVAGVSLRIPAERITAYQDGEQVGRLVRRLNHKRAEIPDVSDQQAKTFVPNKED